MEKCFLHQELTFYLFESKCDIIRIRKYFLYMARFETVSLSWTMNTLANYAMPLPLLQTWLLWKKKHFTTFTVIHAVLFVTGSAGICTAALVLHQSQECNNKF
jgi:hypothetical protein